MVRKFDLIADSRFGQDLTTLEQWTANILTELNELSVKVTMEPPRRITFLEGAVIQWRRMFYVQLDAGQGTTWRQIYEAVNKTKTVAFETNK